MVDETRLIGGMIWDFKTKKVKIVINSNKYIIFALLFHLNNINKVHNKEEKLAAFGRLLDVQDRLRIQCPWDKKQTFESLRPNTIEETFELCDALMKRDYKNIKKELGDVLEHVMFYSIIGREDEEFDICDVCNQEADKLMFRHPFINWREEGNWTVANPDMYINEAGQVMYKEKESEDKESEGAEAASLALGADKPKNAASVEKTWEQIKQQEKDGNERVLSGVPMPCPRSSRLIAYRTRHATWVSIGKRKRMCGTRCMRNWKN
mgnify:FL=1